MALPSLASTHDLLNELGLAGYETLLDETRAERALAKASALVRAEVGLTWSTDGVTLDAGLPDAAFEVTLSVAARRYNNPNGDEAETIGPFTFRSSGGGNEAVGVFLTDGERKMLRSIAGTKGDVNVLQFSSPWGLSANTGYVPVEGGGDAFPLFAE